MAERNEHLVVVMLEPVPAGEEFEVWPMHITIVPWFPCGDPERLDTVLTEVASRHSTLEVKAGKIEEWGHDEKFKVMKIDDTGRLHTLHWDVLHSLEKNGFSIHQKDYLGEKYRPHVTLRNRKANADKYSRGETITIGRITLVKQLRLKGSGRMIKSLVKDFELHG